MTSDTAKFAACADDKNNKNKRSGERGRNRTYNLLIKSHVRFSIQKLITNNKPITYKSLARTENSLQVLEKFAIFCNAQPQLQPHIRQRRQFTPMTVSS